MLVDNKFMIGIPFFNLTISDNLFTLIEILKSLDMLKDEFIRFLKEEKLRKNTNINNNSNVFGNSTKNFSKSTPNFNNRKISGSKSRISKEDAILLEELNFLLRDHLKEDETKKNCKHCIIKFKKSSVIFNLIFGNFPTFFKDFHKTDFFLLEKLMKKNQSEDKNFGIFIDFFSSQRMKTKVYEALQIEDNKDKNYVVSLNWPLLLVTIDTGFFKNNMTIHCSRSITLKKQRKDNINNEERKIPLNIINLEEMKSPDNNIDSNLSSPETRKLLSGGKKLDYNELRKDNDYVTFENLSKKFLENEVSTLNQGLFKI